MHSLLDDIHEKSASVLSARMDSNSETVITVGDSSKRFDSICEDIGKIEDQCDAVERLYSIKRTGLPAEQKRLAIAHECTIDDALFIH